MCSVAAHERLVPLISCLPPTPFIAKYPGNFCFLLLHDVHNLCYSFSTLISVLFSFSMTIAICYGSFSAILSALLSFSIIIIICYGSFAAIISVLFSFSMMVLICSALLLQEQKWFQLASTGINPDRMIKSSTLFGKSSTNIARTKFQVFPKMYQCRNQGNLFTANILTLLF